MMVGSGDETMSTDELQTPPTRRTATGQLDPAAGLNPVDRCRWINRRAALSPLAEDRREGQPAGQHTPWRIAPEPLALPARAIEQLRRLGEPLLAFYRAANRLYLDSARGSQPAWVHRYLDAGKPDGLRDYARMNRFKGQLPAVIRPDIFLTERGPVATELDSVPGGIGNTAFLNDAYSELGFPVVGGARGMVEGFKRMVEGVTTAARPVLAVVVSEEARDYRPEMLYLEDELNRRGLCTHVLRPEQLTFREEGLSFHDGVFEHNVDVIYRFFEMFDLKNIPKAELLMYANKKERVVVTPPFKYFLEEKLLFALFHHPALRRFWLDSLGQEHDELLRGLMPRTWVLDPRELPPHAVIPDLQVNGQPVQSWAQLFNTTKKNRDFVIKASGFSELAWGSHGVSFAFDQSNEVWQASLARSLDAFPATPFVLQEFHKSPKVPMRFYNCANGEIRSLEGRARLCPYYFVSGGQAELGGILATIVPPDKKAIHGMLDGVMTPVMPEPET